MNGEACFGKEWDSGEFYKENLRGNSEKVEQDQQAMSQCCQNRVLENEDIREHDRTKPISRC